MNRAPLFTAVLLAFFQVSFTHAQVVEVDTTRATNHFVPKDTLGAGVDRISVEAIDKDLLQPTLSQTQESGWQPVTYRQNTELMVEAWHWNAAGKWSNVEKKEGYFTGSAGPEEMIRHSYAYPLPHRGFSRGDGNGNGRAGGRARRACPSRDVRQPAPSVGALFAGRSMVVTVKITQILVLGRHAGS